MVYEQMPPRSRSSAIDNTISYPRVVEPNTTLVEEKIYLEDKIRTEHNFEEIVGTSVALRRVLKQVEAVAPTDATVLLQGETRTGKEIIACAIHNLSAHRNYRAKRDQICPPGRE